MKHTEGKPGKREWAKRICHKLFTRIVKQFSIKYVYNVQIVGSRATIVCSFALNAVAYS